MNKNFLKSIAAAAFSLALLSGCAEMKEKMGWHHHKCHDGKCHHKHKQKHHCHCDNKHEHHECKGMMMKGGHEACEHEEKEAAEMKHNAEKKATAKKAHKKSKSNLAPTVSSGAEAGQMAN